ncbi:carotenoid biosynthesis protein [Rubrobacter marinus]|uniref:carotenoid biosynthesis protein n=1 Tax=Rubrobacter marinus TaxID=2653852 RepID=UPI00140B80F9|nr:carotenoid biosynthesis protein [Rubrobacter marinus]
MIRRVFAAAPRLLILVSALFLGASYFTVRFPDVPGAGIGSFVSTFLIALPALAALLAYLGPAKAALAFLALAAFGYAIETTGVVTGLPYGTFFYGDALGPKLFGLVPFLLPISWAPLVLGAVAAAAPRPSYGRGAARTIGWIFRSAVLLTLIDGVLDPGAASLGFWTWPEGGPYYGIPLSNYAGWLLSGALATALVLAFGRRRWGRVAPPPGMVDSAVIAVAFWVGVAVFSGLLFPAVLGAALFVYLLHRRLRLRNSGKRRGGAV